MSDPTRERIREIEVGVFDVGLSPALGDMRWLIDLAYERAALRADAPGGTTRDWPNTHCVSCGSTALWDAANVCPDCGVANYPSRVAGSPPAASGGADAPGGTTVSEGRELYLGGILGGQVWQQERFPFMRRYVTLLGDGRFALLSMPDEQGSCACTEKDGKWSYTYEELRDKFDRLGYKCAGRFIDIATVRVAGSPVAPAGPTQEADELRADVALVNRALGEMASLCSGLKKAEEAVWAVGMAFDRIVAKARAQAGERRDAAIAGSETAGRGSASEDGA